MSEHYIITLDHGHLRIYLERIAPGQFTPSLEPMEMMDFPAGRHSYSDRDTDMAGRFPSAGVPGQADTGHRGMSIDERLPMQREENRRRARELASMVESFLEQRAEASWDFAAGPDLNHAVLELLSPPVRRRLRRSVPKDLVNQRLDEVRAHFAGI
jgi:hypothetical protein